MKIGKNRGILLKLSRKARRRTPHGEKGIKIAAQNRKAFHDYFVEDKYEAGIELFGTEVKSIRAGTLNLKDSYCTVKGGELFLHGMHISPYEKETFFNKDPVRSRRLLMHKREIRKLSALVQPGWLCAGPAVRLLQRCPGKGGGWPLQGQEELRQAGGRFGRTPSGRSTAL